MFRHLLDIGTKIHFRCINIFKYEKMKVKILEGNRAEYLVKMWQVF